MVIPATLAENLKFHFGREIGRAPEFPPFSRSCCSLPDLMPETCPECGRLFISFRALSCHFDSYAARTRTAPLRQVPVPVPVPSRADISPYAGLPAPSRSEHPHEYTANAIAVLDHARKKARENDDKHDERVEAARTRTLTPGEPLLPPPLAVCSPYVGDLGDVLGLFGNRRTLRFFLRHEKLVCALALARAAAQVADSRVVLSRRRRARRSRRRRP